MIWARTCSIVSTCALGQRHPDTYVSLAWFDNQKCHSWQLANVMC